MKKAFTAIALVAMSIFLVGWSFGDKKPKKSELESAFKMELPSYVQLSDFDVEILENMGNKVDPRWGSRFKAIVKTKVPLYTLEQQDKKKKLLLLFSKIQMEQKQKYLERSYPQYTKENGNIISILKVSQFVI